MDMIVTRNATWTLDLAVLTTWYPKPKHVRKSKIHVMNSGHSSSLPLFSGMAFMMGPRPSSFARPSGTLSTSFAVEPPSRRDGTQCLMIPRSARVPTN